MKKTLILLFVLAFSAALSAQQSADEKYLANMRKAMVNLDSSWVDFTKMRETANQFDRLANYKKEDWTPRYYHAMCLLMYSWVVGEKERPSVLDAAGTALKTAAALSPNNSEIVALEGYMYQAMIMLNPMSNGPIYGPKSAETLQRAAELDPANPRPHYLLGQNLYYTPAQWGGGEAVARPHLEKAMTLFEAFVPANEFSPNWGKVPCQMLLEGKMKK